MKSIGLSQFCISFVLPTELSNIKSKCPSSESVVRVSHGVRVSFPGSCGYITGLVAMLYNKLLKSVSHSLYPCET